MVCPERLAICGGLSRDPRIVISCLQMVVRMMDEVEMTVMKLLYSELYNSHITNSGRLSSSLYLGKPDQFYTGMSPSPNFSAGLTDCKRRSDSQDSRA